MGALAGPFGAVLFRQTGWHIAVGIACALLGAVAGPAAMAQDADVQRQALEAFHGPDLTGKDGPLAPVGLDLTRLYVAWRVHQAQGGDAPFAPSGALPLRDGYVTVDATAAGDPAALRDSLEALGLTSSAQAGRVVSGQLPIAAIAEAARLPALRAMRPARAATHGAAPRSPDSDTAAAAPAPPPDDASSAMYWIGGAVVLIVGLLFFLLRR